MVESILVVGATGFTGSLVAEYLGKYPNPTFRLQLGARSPSKLAHLISEKDLTNVTSIVVDVTKEDDVEKAVLGADVIINCAGPFGKYGTPVLAACARHGRHYVDITGEVWWIQEMIEKFDYLAYKNGATIIPASAFDSIPADILAYFSVKTLKSIMGPETTVGKSITAHKLKSTMSGGTAATVVSAFDGGVSPSRLEEALKPYALSPIKGKSVGELRLLYSLPHVTHPPVHGSYFIMSGVNTAVVRRTWGLLQTRDAAWTSYGDSFDYDEFMALPSIAMALFVSTLLAFGTVLLKWFSPVRSYFLSKMPLGSGPSPEILTNGWYKGVNVTSSLSDPPRHVQTTLKIKGDPGYAGAAVMVSESAIALLPQNRGALTPLGREGGVLTPMSAIGDTLIERLQATDRIEIESFELVDGRAKKD